MARAPAWPAVLGLLVVGCYLGAFGWAMNNTSYDVWGAMLVAPGLVAVSVPLLCRAARAEADPRTGRLLWWAFGSKLAVALVTYGVAFGVYHGVADASLYSSQGAHVADALRSGHLVVPRDGALVGTSFTSLVTGFVYAVIGPTIVGGYLVFAWLGFWGLYLFYRAFVLAVPDGDHRRYALLVLLLPSLLYWSSALGKDAWMVLCLGIAAYGTARLLVRARGAFVLMAIGLVGTAMVRPHITLLVVASVTLGYLVRGRQRGATVLAPVWKGAGLAVLVVGCVVVVGQAAHFLDTHITSVDSVQSVLQRAETNTNQGGSQFDASPVRSPLAFPGAVVTVLFRPFPTEAHGFQALMAALEGSFLMVLIALSWRRLAALPRMVRQRPYLVVALVYTATFVYVFSGFGNFGLLARERAQVYPFALAALAVQPRQARSAAASAAGLSYSQVAP